jgi:hypothetical protein
VCYGNQLKTLDVSLNLELTHLDCGDNAITLLDVTKLTKLGSLLCGSNKLTSLDTSKNTALTSLDCSDNALTAINVTKNTKLDSLICFSNALAALDVSKNTALTLLDCADNKLAELPTAKNTKLVTLNCTGNQIKTLDLSKNTKLVYLYGAHNLLTALNISKCVLLEELDCSYNGLTVLDLSAATSLLTLWCENNKLAKLDLSGLMLLGYADCSNNSIATLGLAGTTRLKTLICASNKLAALDLSQSLVLEELDCAKNNLKTLSVAPNDELRYIDCSDNRLNALDVKGNAKLRYLDVRNNYFAAESAITGLNKPALEAEGSGDEHGLFFAPQKDPVLREFEDLDPDAWYMDYVLYALKRKLFAGISATEFGPGKPMTRAMLVTVLYNLADSPAHEAKKVFNDVPENAYYFKPLSWAYTSKVVAGTSATTFTPDANITREQFAVMLYQYAQKYLGKDVTSSAVLAFADKGSISAYAAEAVRWCAGAGIVAGKSDNMFDPQGQATRAEAAAMLRNFERWLGV